MKRAELIEIIGNGENSGVEFKLDGIRSEQLAKEVVALANVIGGRILIGIAHVGTIHGTKRENLETWVMDTVFACYVHPMILPFYEEVQLYGGKQVAVISFSEGISKPYVVRSKDCLKAGLFRSKVHRDPKNVLLQADNGSSGTQYDPLAGGHDLLNDPLN